MRISALALAAAFALAPVLPLHAAQRLTDAELNEMRGGFSIDGVEISLGVVLRTVVDGRVALETRMTLDANGSQVQRLAGAGTTPFTAANATRIRVDLAPGADGVLLNNGATAVLHQIEPGRLGSFVLNTADGQNVRQETSVTLTIPALAQLQTGWNNDLTGFRLGSDVQAAQAAALRR